MDWQQLLVACGNIDEVVKSANMSFSRRARTKAAGKARIRTFYECVNIKIRHGTCKVEKSGLVSNQFGEKA